MNRASKSLVHNKGYLVSNPHSHMTQSRENLLLHQHIAALNHRPMGALQSPSMIQWEKSPGLRRIALSPEHYWASRGFTASVKPLKTTRHGRVFQSSACSTCCSVRPCEYACRCTPFKAMCLRRAQEQKQEFNTMLHIGHNWNLQNATASQNNNSSILSHS